MRRPQGGPPCASVIQNYSAKSMMTLAAPQLMRGYQQIEARTMYEIWTNRFTGSIAGERYNLHDLPIKDTHAHKLTREDLYRELVALKVPGIEAHFGHQDLSLAYVTT
jgi:hypothetical protein